MFQFAGLAILFLTQGAVIMNKASGIDQMIELSGVSRSMRGFANLAAEIPKFFLSNLVILLFTIIIPMGANLHGLGICQLFVFIH
jgi:hypothetical protein